MKPVYEKHICDGYLKLCVYGASRNWRISGETAQEMEQVNPGIVEALQKVLVRQRIERALVPKSVFGTNIVNRVHLRHELFPRFFRGAEADGVRLNQTNDAYLLSSGDCPCVVICDPTKAIALALHAGRDALLDRGFIAGQQGRAQFSVIDQAMNLMRNRGWIKTSPIHVFIAAGIGSSQFTHPTTPTIVGEDGQESVNEHQSANQELIEFLLRSYDHNRFKIVTNSASGSLNLVELIIAQLAVYGVRRDCIVWDGVDTSADKGPDGHHLYHSNRRDKTKRNLVVVKLH